MNMRRRAVLLLCLTLLVAACAVDVVDAPIVGLVSSFQPSGALAPNRIGLSEDTTFPWRSDRYLWILASSGGIEDLQRVSYLLTYDPDLIQFEHAIVSLAGIFGYESVEFDAHLEAPGRLRVVNAGREGVGVSIPGSLHILRFTPLRQGQGRIEVQELVATDSAGRVIPGVQGLGGTVVVVRVTGDRG